MIAVDEAEKIVLEHAAVTAAHHVPLSHAINCVLRENINADRAMPPFDRVTMDGIAINFANWSDGQRLYTIEDIQAAGMPQKSLMDPKNCLEVMTGAIRPEGTDTVIPYEEITIKEKRVEIHTENIKHGQNIHEKGSDRHEKELLIKHGKLIGPAEINICATVGKSEVLVSKFPKVMIVSTGDELVPIHTRPLAHQIRRSNVFGLQASLEAMGVPCASDHIDDNKELIINKISKYLNDFDVIILSGGVSAGKYDYVPEAMDSLGVHRLFHKVQQRPGKPFWFGQHPSGTTVFALPGNPVSSFLCTYRYFMPWLYKSIGIELSDKFAQLAADIHFPKDLTYFAQVTLTFDKGHLLAFPVEGNGSGDLSNLSDADAFMELPRGKELYKEGEIYKIFPYRSLNVI